MSDTSSTPKPISPPAPFVGTDALEE